MGSAVPTLAAVTLSLDEVEYLVDKLKLDVLPVVLDTNGRYDSLDARDAAFRAAADTLAARDLLPGGGVHPDLADYLRVLARPRWEIALRWFVKGSISRMCVAKGHDFSVLAVRGAESIIVQDGGTDVLAPIVSALGSVNPMKLGAVNAPTAALGTALDEGMNGQSTAANLSKLGVPSADSGPLGNAMASCDTWAEIVGIAYGDGRSDPVGGPVTVFDTDQGRIVGTTSVSGDDTSWTSLSSGTNQRLRQALESLAARLG